jgi:hypothetical protein
MKKWVEAYCYEIRLEAEEWTSAKQAYFEPNGISRGRTIIDDLPLPGPFRDFKWCCIANSFAREVEKL